MFSFVPEHLAALLLVTVRHPALHPVILSARQPSYQSLYSQVEVLAYDFIEQPMAILGERLSLAIKVWSNLGRLVTIEKFEDWRQSLDGLSARCCWLLVSELPIEWIHESAALAFFKKVKKLFEPKAVEFCVHRPAVRVKLSFLPEASVFASRDPVLSSLVFVGVLLRVVLLVGR